MAKKKNGLTNLLNQLIETENTPKVFDGKLPNTKSTWERIGSRDSFQELGLESSELDEFLKEWIGENDYEAIK